MGYFQISFQTLLQIAQWGGVDDLAGFLVLARHASGLSYPGFAPYTLSGCGVNAVHEKVGRSEGVAREILARLHAHGVIRPASLVAKQAFPQARWEVIQGELDLDLPHAFVDRDAKIESVLHRLREKRIAPRYVPADACAELQLDALFTLLVMYRLTNMCMYGGVATDRVSRAWEAVSIHPDRGAAVWHAEPGVTHFDVNFKVECLRRDAIAAEANGLSAHEEARFNNAWRVIVDAGLAYEVVTLYLHEPAKDGSLRACAIRVNDFHAGSITRRGDPSIARKLEETTGTELFFYTPEDNPRGDPEGFRVCLPIGNGRITGVWRLRLRCSNADTGKWLKSEEERVQHVFNELKRRACWPQFCVAET